jgi:hypothetical protein
MGEAARILLGGPSALYVVGFGLVCISAQVFFSYERTVRLLKWLTLVLFSYVAVVLTVQVPWRTVLIESLVPWSFLPEHTLLKDYAAMVVAVLGTTISPYLFFWQATMEVEEMKHMKTHTMVDKKLIHEMKQDVDVGMGFSGVVAWFIILTTGTGSQAGTGTFIKAPFSGLYTRNVSNVITKGTAAAGGYWINFLIRFYNYDYIVNATASRRGGATTASETVCDNTDILNSNDTRTIQSVGINVLGSGGGAVDGGASTGVTIFSPIDSCYTP